MENSSLKNKPSFELWSPRLRSPICRFIVGFRCVDHTIEIMNKTTINCGSGPTSRGNTGTERRNRHEPSMQRWLLNNRFIVTCGDAAVLMETSSKRISHYGQERDDQSRLWKKQTLSLAIGPLVWRSSPDRLRDPTAGATDTLVGQFKSTRKGLCSNLCVTLSTISLCALKMK